MQTYEEQINNLIPFATKTAKRKVERLSKSCEKRINNDGTPRLHCFFTELFHKEMNKLAYKEGLRGWR